MNDRYNESNSLRSSQLLPLDTSLSQELSTLIQVIQSKALDVFFLLYLHLFYIHISCLSANADGFIFKISWLQEFLTILVLSSWMKPHILDQIAWLLSLVSPSAASKEPILNTAARLILLTCQIMSLLSWKPFSNSSRGFLQNLCLCNTLWNASERS